MASPEQDASARPPAPGVLAVEVTTRCNRACAYCYNAWRTDPAYPRTELPTPDLVALVRDLLAHSGLRRVQLSGGEPLLREDLFTLVESLRLEGHSVSLLTDGGLIDEEVARALARWRVGPVQPTLLSDHRDVHNALKGADCFDATIKGLGLLRRHGVPTSVAFVCTRHSSQHFQGVVELCFALGVKTVAFSRLCAAGQGARGWTDLAPTLDDVHGCLEVAAWAQARLGMRVPVSISLPFCAVDRARFPSLKLGTCALLGPTPGLTLDPAGNLRACSISPVVLGNVREEPWAVVMERARTGYLANMAVVPTDCHGCPDVGVCRGGCRVSAVRVGGSALHADPLAQPRPPGPTQASTGSTPRA